jgi:hypothetical protein
MNDKIKHLIAGVVISTIALVVALLIFGTDKRGTDIAMLAAFSSAALAGLTKELYDKYIKKTFMDLGDLTMTWIACFVPIGVWGIIQNFI